MSKLEPMTLSISFNDYGLNLTTNSKKDLTITEWQKLLTPDDLIEELLDCMNRSEMAKRQFRDVARVAGLPWSPQWLWLRPWSPEWRGLLPWSPL